MAGSGDEGRLADVDAGGVVSHKKAVEELSRWVK
jgi:hypothetical protein